MFQLQQSFFGLAPDRKFKESLLTEFFYLTRYTSLGFDECLRLPVPVRRFFFESLMENLREEEKRKQI